MRWTHWKILNSVERQWQKKTKKNQHHSEPSNFSDLKPWITLISFQTSMETLQSSV
jgi:hypothetical protein